MKALLINPPINHSNSFNIPAVVSDAGMKFPPLGILYIASFIKHKGLHDVKVVDMEAQAILPAQVVAEIGNYCPDVVGLYTTSFNLAEVISLSRLIKGFDPQIRICLGGPHVNIYPQETVSFNTVDFLVLGEGELSFHKLLDSLQDDAALGGIEGIVYKDHGKIVVTGRAKPVENLDILPFPERKMLPLNDYRSSVSRSFPSTTILSGRGCPYRCIFCYHSYLGPMRFRSSDNVVSEMEACSDMGIKDIFFYDDTFIIDKRRTADICNKIIERGLKIDWAARTRVDSIDAGILAILRKAGCRRIQLGVEAGTEEALSILNKGISLKQAEEAFRLAKSAGMDTLAYFMLGSPGEKKEDILRTIDFAVRLDPDFVHFSVTFPYPGTDLYQMGLTQGIFKNDYWKDFAITADAGFKPQLWEEWVSKKELNDLIRYSYQKFYFRPRYMFRTLFHAGSLRQIRKIIVTAIKLFNFIFVKRLFPG